MATSRSGPDESDRSDAALDALIGDTATPEELRALFPAPVATRQRPAALEVDEGDAARHGNGEGGGPVGVGRNGD